MWNVSGALGKFFFMASPAKALFFQQIAVIYRGPKISILARTVQSIRDRQPHIFLKSNAWVTDNPSRRQYRQCLMLYKKIKKKGRNQPFFFSET